MRIVVAVKQVPIRDSFISIDDSGKRFEEQDLAFEINEPDAYALEAALLLNEKHGRWLPMERQVGSSGQSVSPKLYVAVAPIFEVADYAIIGDLFAVVPALTAAVRKTRET
jgi:hypothetical protein